MLWQNLLADISQYIKHLTVAEYMKRPWRLKLKGYTHHPDNAKNMVGMCMSDNEVVNVLALDS
jgi:hypothetical protein